MVDLDLVRSKPCMVCGVPPPSEAHHLPGPGGRRRRAQDIVIPLCPMHHRWVHSSQKGQEWERENLENLWGWALGYTKQDWVELWGLKGAPW